MTTVEQKKNLKSFVKAWKDRGYEKGETQQFWLQLLRAIGYDYVDSVLFEKPLKSRGFPDVWLREVNVMVEQKSLGVDLGKPEPRQGEMKTPFKQVLDYAEDVPINEQPSYLMTCNFGTFRIYDRAKWHKSELEQHPFEFSLEELAEHPDYLNCITDPQNTRLEKEKQVSIKAGEQIGKLYDMLREGYLDPDSEESMHALNVLCVRLVFCLYCEDADLFEKDAFLQYLKGTAPEDVRSKLKRLFKALDTEKAFRDPYDTGCKPFPYVNGGLFAEDVEIPNFSQQALDFLIDEVSAPIDWSQISPTIFGGIFESTLNPETRRSGGMHYTSPENIHKVIDPLFLDDLKEEYRAIRDDEDLTPRQKRNRYKKFHQKLCSLTFFDPACGSGNFLTETYLCLRKLEDKVLDELQFGQLQWSSTEEEEAGERISLSQFHGIEINDFAVSVAETALYISRLKANNDTLMLLDLDNGDLPLKESAHIVHGNALRLDWNNIVHAEECNYIMGNPPFYGARMQSKEQKADIQEAFHGSKNSGNIDYVAGWYIKTAEYMAEWPIRAAFVSTNSICQGEQVANIWKPIFDLGVQIDFAHNTFRWRNEATEQAHVFVVIIGFSKLGGIKTLFYHANPDSAEVVSHPANINAYLSTAPNVFVWNRNKPLCSVPKIGIGNKPIDGGNYLFRNDEKDDFLSDEPAAEQYFHTWLGSEEFLNNKPRSVLWLGDTTEEELANLPKCCERIENVRKFRLASSSEPTRKLADKPTRFHVENMPKGTSILVPKVSSERRHYVPLGFIGPETFCSDLVFLICDATIYHYGVLQSQFHNAWMRVVAGRLKSDYRYSGGMVYNNFIWPDPTDEQRLAIETCAKAVLTMRENYPDDSLAMLYDPDKMPDDLLAAHRALDKAVEEAYGVDFGGDEERIVDHLFRLYEAAMREEQGVKSHEKKQVDQKQDTTSSKATVKVKVKVKSVGEE